MTHKTTDADRRLVARYFAQQPHLRAPHNLSNFWCAKGGTRLALAPTVSTESKILMIFSWWLLWAVFMFAFFVPSLGYGWGYRRWGPPYPKFIQKRRSVATDGTGAFNYLSWGWAGDFVWMVMLICIFSALAVMWWQP